MQSWLLKFMWVMMASCEDDGYRVLDGHDLLCKLGVYAACRCRSPSSKLWSLVRPVFYSVLVHAMRCDTDVKPVFKAVPCRP